MMLRRSSFVHLVPLGPDMVLVLHAASQLRLTITDEVAAIIAHFSTPQPPDGAIASLAARLGHDEATIRAGIELLTGHGILTAATDSAEQATLAAELAPLHGRDPAALLDRYRRARAEGTHPYWSVAAPRGLSSAPAGRRIDLLLLGECDVQMEADFLRQGAAARGIDLHVAAAFAQDIELVRERRHDAIIVGALAARHAIILGEPRHHDEGDPALVYVGAMRALLERLRAVTAAPILIDGLPEPVVQPLGIADRGIHSHRNRFRRANLALAELAGQFADVTLVDIAAALAAAGAEALLDDGLVSFSHFGAPGWMLLRPPGELGAVHGQFPELAPLAEQLGGDPNRRERVVARAHFDHLVSLLGIDRRKCVIVDLDGVLWPGVLAETGAPFAWAPDISGPNSFIGLYFGIHEALLALRRRGILLACVSKNDEATVRALWRYQPQDPHERLLLPEHFVTHRINWADKAGNIASIAEELGFAESDFVFIDDSPRERARIAQALPEVAVLGENLFTLRRALLTDPRLQPPHITEASARRSELVRAQLDRARLRAAMPDEAAFIAALAPRAEVTFLAGDTQAATLDRVAELFVRTTQFNATGMRFSTATLAEIIAAADGRVAVLHMRDNSADHGLVGAAVLRGGEILNFVMSCRVIGLGGEKPLLDALARDRSAHGAALFGRIIATDRNLPARHLYRNAGFTQLGDGTWRAPSVSPAEAA